MLSMWRWNVKDLTTFITSSFCDNLARISYILACDMVNTRNFHVPRVLRSLDYIFRDKATFRSTLLVHVESYDPYLPVPMAFFVTSLGYRLWRECSIG